MKKRTLIIVVIIIAICAGIYLNRAYAYVYSKFDLTSAPAQRTYTTQTMTAKSNLLRYVAIGDSLTAGVGATGASSTFPALLAEKLAVERGVVVQVYNLGAPGATSFDILTGQVLDANQYQPDIVTIFIGINDMHNFVPLEKYRSNLETAIEAVKKTGAAKIYLINLPYLGAKDLILPPYDFYFDLKTRQYNEIIAETGAASGLAVIDLYDVAKADFAADQDLYSQDRYHPSDRGYQLWANKIYVQLQ